MQRGRAAVLVHIVVHSVLGRGVSGQHPVAVAAQDEAQLVVQAEYEGSKYGRLDLPGTLGANFRTEVNGTSDRKCVEGYERGPVRSGEFVIGGQLGGMLGATAGLPAKIWWAPLHFGSSMPTLVVRMRNLAAPTDTVVVSNNRIGFVKSSESGGNEYFFPSGITLPRAGRWLLVASSGPNWGCFILRVR